MRSCWTVTRYYVSGYCVWNRLAIRFRYYWVASLMRVVGVNLIVTKDSSNLLLPSTSGKINFWYNEQKQICVYENGVCASFENRGVTRFVLLQSVSGGWWFVVVFLCKKK